MQVKVYLQDDQVVVDLCTTDQPRKVSFPLSQLDNSNSDSAVWLTFPDPDGSTVYRKPYGEMSSRDQEEHIAIREKQRDDALRAEGKDAPGDNRPQTAPSTGGYEKPVGEAASSAVGPAETDSTFSESREAVEKDKAAE